MLRKKGLPYLVIAVVVLLPLIAVGCFILFRTIVSGEEPSLGWTITILGAAIVVGTLEERYFGAPTRRFKRKFRQEILPTVVRLVHPGLIYAPGDGLYQADFEASGLYPESVDAFKSENLFEGRVGNTVVRFADVHAMKDTGSEKKGRFLKNVFRGHLFVADFHKHFRGEVFLSPDLAEAKLGRLGRRLQRIKGSVEFMEDPEFEKAFVVRAVDPVEVRYILTPDMQRRLLALRSRVGAEVRVSFRHSSVFVALPHKKNWLNPDLKRHTADQPQLQFFLSQVAVWTEMVEELNLNTRIWTKV